VFFVWCHHLGFARAARAIQQPDALTGLGTQNSGQMVGLLGR